MADNTRLPTMEEHADALHPVKDTTAPWGRDAKGRPRAFQDSIRQGSTMASAPASAPKAPTAPAMGLIDALRGPVK